MSVNFANVITGAVGLAMLQVAITASSQAGETRAWSFEVVNVIDLAANVDGGAETGESLVYNLDVTAEYDMSHSGVEGGTLFFYGLATNAEGLNSHVGDAQGTSNIDNGALFRLEELWYNQEFADGKASVLVGLFDLNGEFDAIDTAGLFLNSSHGIGVDYAQTGENGPSIFPSTSLALRLDYAVNDRLTLRTAILDAVPNDPDNPKAHKLSFDEGALIAVEGDYADADNLRLAAGMWWYTSDFDRILVADGGPDSDNFGFYGIADYALSDRTSAFARLGRANDEINQIAWYLGAGIVTTGLIPQRPDDALGLAVAIAENGSPFKDAAALALSPVDDREIAVELTYRAGIYDWLAVQPDLQYVLDPGMDPSLDDAFVANLRVEIGWAF